MEINDPDVWHKLLCYMYFKYVIYMELLHSVKQAFCKYLIFSYVILVIFVIPDNVIIIRNCNNYVKSI